MRPLIFSSHDFPEKVNSKIEVPKPQVIDRAQVHYASASLTATVPLPAAIDRRQVTYVSNTPTAIIVPKAAAIDRSKLRYRIAPIIPQPARVDRTQLKYASSAPIIIVPQPAIIDRAQLRYKLMVPPPARIQRDDVIYKGSPLRIRKPATIERSKLVYSEPKLTTLEKNIHSPKTAGEQFFPQFEVTSELEAEADRRIAQYPADQIRSAVLPLLHAVQHKFGFISPESIDWVAGKLSIEPMKVVEVVTFYPGFRQKAPGKLHVRVCRTLSCAMGGSYELMEKLCQITGIDRSKEDGHKNTISVSPCGNFSVEYAECLASCGTAPVCLVNDDFHEGITAEKAQALLDQYQTA